MEVINKRLSMLSLLIVLAIGCQQFPVIRIGGSFKLYELLGLCIVFLFVLGDKIKLKWIDIPVILFFLLSPNVSAVVALLFTPSEILSLYYEQFPLVIDEFRYNIYSAIIFPCIYYVCCGFSFIAIANASITRRQSEVFLKIFFSVATIISVSSLVTAVLNGYFGLLGPVQLLPDYVQNVGKATYGFRTFGFTQEPSFYVFYQGWVVLIMYFYRSIFRACLFWPLFLINVLALVMTFSSAIGGFFLAVSIIVFCKSSLVSKLKFGLVVAVVSLSVFSLVDDSSILDYAYYFLIEKVFNFFSYPTHTLDSGSFRSFTNFLGLYIFFDNFLLGVGPGASIFYMPSYERYIGIQQYGEMLNAGSFPQNSYSSVLAELGVVGFIPMIFILCVHLVVFFRSIKYDVRLSAFAAGVLFTMFALLSIAPAYSMFIWVFIAFGRMMLKLSLSHSV